MPDPTQASGLFWATVFGAAIGIVAGTLIQYFINILWQRKSKSRQKEALIKELSYNRSLVDELSQEITKLRNAVNGRTLDKYFGFFNYNMAIFSQAQASASNGTLYEFLDVEEIRRAQRIVSTLSAANATWVNGEVTRRREGLVNSPNNFDWREAVSFVDFLDNQINDLKSHIDALVMKLK